MCCGVKDDTKMPKAGSTIMNLTFLLLGFSSLFGPVTGFAMKYCKISYEKAICTCIKPKLGAVPRDIPSTVKGFDLSYNKISKIFVSDFKNLTLLVQLNLKFNQISQIEPGSFAALISLQRLDLNGNQLVNLTENLFEGLGNLKELRIHQNHIKKVAPQCFKPLTSLNLLDITDNKLHTLAKVHSILMHLPNLQSLSIKKNHFTTFQSWQLTNVSLALTKLDLSNNEIAVFRITADVFPNLTKLVLGQSLRKEPVIWDVRGEFLRRVSALDISGLRLAFEDMKRLQERVGSSLTSLTMNGMRHNLSALVKTSCTIPTMSHLRLLDNRLTYVSSDFLLPCVNVTILDLTRNQIANIKDGAFRTMTALRTLILDYNRFQSVPPDLRNLPRLSQLHLRYNSIGALGCQDFDNLTRLRHLDLCQNSISELKECVFRDLVGLQYLTLQNNSITKLNGAFGKYLPNLIKLQLSGNKITTITRGEFMGLKSLQNLSLNENQINVMEKGAFRGLTNVAYIRLQRNDIHTKVISDGLLSDLINLRSLELRENHISYSDSSALSDPPFSKLAHLEVLNMLSQHHSGKSMLPCNILQGLTNLLEFSTRDVQLLSLPKGIFNHTPNLKKLDISSNDLSNITSDLFYPIQGLRKLSISGVGLGSLDFLIDANLTQLEFLQSRKNKYSVISKELINSLPALKYVDFQSNSFFCHCNNAWFIKWVKENNQTQVFDAYNFLCSYPAPLLGTKLLDFNIQSCSLDTDFICFICTTCFILLFLATTFTYHFLRLQLTYAYYFYLALLFDAKTKKSPHQYDAFISYNTHDEPWVFRELVPKLEGEQGWRLCLHHRDFEPGKAIVDNITDAIYGSRKTICVISQRYLESEWCSREIQVASFRLFDEQKDVLILVFLEDIPTYHLSPYYRMRKLLKRKTYLSWTKAAEHPEVFWEKLRHALRTKEDLGEDGLVLPVDV